MNERILDQLSSVNLPGNWTKLGGDVTNKEYRKIVAYDNCTSYSQLTALHKCPRLYQLEKAEAKQPSIDEFSYQSNLDFAFGHSVGAGISTLIATKNLTAGLFAAFVAWKADYFADNGKGKSLAFAQIAIEQFAHQQLLSDWDVYELPSGAPAVEVAFMIDAENGYQHYGHIDTILQNRRTRRLAVLECKTTGYESIDEALFANSSQALSYGVVLDSIAPGNTDYEVIYIVYSSKSRKWEVLPFTKSLSEKAGWLQDLLLDHGNIATYRQLKFFPKRGESCANQYGRRCRYFGVCDITSHAKDFVDIPAERTAENVNFQFKLSDLIKQQRENRA